jgi:hypothetical protein
VVNQPELEAEYSPLKSDEVRRKCVYTFSPSKNRFLRKIAKSLGRGRILWINDLNDNMCMGFGTWNVERKEFV